MRGNGCKSVNGSSKANPDEVWYQRRRGSSSLCVSMESPTGQGREMENVSLIGEFFDRKKQKEKSEDFFPLAVRSVVCLRLIK